MMGMDPLDSFSMKNKTTPFIPKKSRSGIQQNETKNVSL